MRHIERWVMALVIGAVPPVVGLLAGWWGTFAFLPEGGVAIASMIGVAAGLLFDALFLGRWIRRAQDAPLWAWCAVYLTYSIGVFGFFMGVPAFNLLQALPAGVLLGGRLARERATGDRVLRSARGASAFTTAVLAAACAASAWLALSDPYTAGNLEGMLGLSFEVTRPMILSLIVIGGSGLLALNWVLTRVAVRWTHARLVAGSSPVP
ncbi:MAG: hypothetical protein EHM59_22405 [Betaproteobacteria bacterium]|nr:MAG: hypothetical protein EHM59_22405 [Betaproteobacteria bacterium]